MKENPLAKRIKDFIGRREERLSTQWNELVDKLRDIQVIHWDDTGEAIEWRIDQGRLNEVICDAFHPWNTTSRVKVGKARAVEELGLDMVTLINSFDGHRSTSDLRNTLRLDTATPFVQKIFHVNSIRHLTLGIDILNAYIDYYHDSTLLNKQQLCSNNQRALHSIQDKRLQHLRALYSKATVQLLPLIIKQPE